MIYLFESPKNYKVSEEARYDHKESFDRFVFRDGKVISKEKIDKPLLFNLHMTKDDAENFDQIINDSSCLLVNKKLMVLLERHVPGQLQFFNAEIRCLDGVLKGYRLVNITQLVEGVDHEKSSYSKMVHADAISSFQKLVLKKDCMNGHKLARLVEYKGHILATEELKQVFEAENITGVRFIKPEDWYAEACPGYSQE